MSITPQPLISIITATYNAAHTIESSILSVEAQTYPNIEHIIVDGISSDETSLIVKDYCHNPKRLYIQEEDLGLYDAMNKGINRSQGEYSIILNADDRFHPTAIEALVQETLLYNVGSVVVSSTAQYVDSHKRLHKTTIYPISDHIYLRMPLRHRTMLVARSLYDTIGLFDMGLKVSADHDLSIRLYEAGVKFPCINRALLFFDCGGISAKVSEKLIIDRVAIASKYFPGESEDVIKSISTDLSRDNILRLLSTNISTKLRKSLRSYVDTYLTSRHSALPSYLNKFWNSQKLSINLMHGNNCNFRLATVCTTTEGGAGKGTLRRVDALRTSGADVNIITLKTKERQSYIKQIFSDSLYLERWHSYIDCAIRPIKQAEGFKSSELFAVNKCILLPATLNKVLAKYDIVHFHWTNGMIDYSKVDSYNWLDKPIVWTFADMHHFTGGCHYSEDCDQYTTGCHGCPLVGEKVDNIVAESLKQKTDFFSKLRSLTVIYPSEWLKKLGERSMAMPRHANHLHIPNPFPFHEFVPILSARSRQKIAGVSSNSNQVILLVGAESLKNKRKGMWLFVNALSMLAGKYGSEDFLVCTFGNSYDGDLHFPVINFGNITDKRKLSEIYSISDFFVFSSLEDNAPLTVAESLACGTPVISSPVGNVLQLVKDGYTGYIYERGSAESLAATLEKAHSSLSYWRSNKITISSRCWHAVKSYNSPRRSIQAHLDLYQSLLN